MYSLERIRELPRTKLVEIISAIVMVAFVALGATAAAMLGPASMPWIVAGCALAALPLLAYAVMRSALVWPLAIYVVLVPFDNLLNLSQSATFTRLLGGASGFILLCALLTGRKVRTPPLPAVLWAVAICWMGTSIMWSPDVVSSRNTLSMMFLLFALYFIISLYPARESDLRALIIATLVGGVFAAIYGLNAYLTGTQTISNRLWLGSSTQSSIDPNHFAAALQLPLMLALAWAIRARKAITKIAFCSCALLFATGMLISASRGALLAAAAGMIFLAWRRRAFVQLGAVAAVAGALSLSFPTVWYRFSDPTQADGAGRVWIWKVGLAAMRDHWLVGSGLGTFSASYDEAFLRVYQPVSEGWSRASHDLVIGTMVELGIIGLLLILAAWFANFRTLSVIPRESRLSWIVVALEATLVALLVESLFLDILFVKYLWLVFTLVAVAYQAFRTEMEESKEPIGDQETAPRVLYHSS